MPRIEGTFPPPMHGVSTVKPRNRGIGYAEQQINFRSDIVDKLVRRPSLVFGHFITDVFGPFRVHHYRRGTDRFQILVVAIPNSATSTVVMRKNGIDVPMNNAQLNIPADRVATLKFMTIKDKTFILDTLQEPDFKKFPAVIPPATELEYLVEDHPVAGTVTERVSHVNITVAGEYGEDITIIVDGTPYTEEIPEYAANAPDTLEFRSTSFIAASLAGKIGADALSTNIFANAKGSTIAIWRGSTGSDLLPGERALPDWVKVELETGQGERSVVPINKRIEKIDGLPLYAVPGTRIAVRPRPSSKDGTYYLEAVPVEGEYIPNSHGRTLEEVVWEEHRSPYEPYTIDASTMPQEVSYLDNGEARVSPVEWDDRRTGDDDSCPPPTFLTIRKPIVDMNYFQNRFVALSDDEVHMTETDAIANWWKASAIQLLVTDPIGIKSSSPNVDVLRQSAPHNRDLLVLSRNGQFKIDGTTAVTPQTVSMQLTTDYECITEPRPVAIGNSVYLPMSYGDSAGLHEYTGEQNTNQDTAYNIASHIRGYIPGSIKLLESSPNLEMLVLTCTGDSGNVLYIYDQHTNKGGERKQQSWSKWVLPVGDDVVHIEFTQDLIELYILNSSKMYVKYLNIHAGDIPEVSVNAVTKGGLHEVFLDNHLVLDTPDGVTLTIDPDYPWSDNTIIVRGANTNYPRTLVGFTKNGNTVTLDENVGLGKLEVGEVFTSSYVPTRPFQVDKDGQTTTTDRIRVAKYRLSITESYEVWMHIISDYYDGEDQGFNSRVMNANNNLIGYEPHSSDEVLFGFSQDAKYALAEFYTDGFLALTIDGITWEGQYYQSSRRM